MVEKFLTDRIAGESLEVLTPAAADMIDEMHRIIQKELTYGLITAASKAYVIAVIESFVVEGAEGVVLGCTECPLMISEGGGVYSRFQHHTDPRASRGGLCFERIKMHFR